MESTPVKRKRGRPPKSQNAGYQDTRQTLIRVGLAALTEKGYSYTGLDEILRQASVPKGSFYHYFENKEAFGKVLIEAYGRFFAEKLERSLSDTSLQPLARIQAFVDDAKAGMQKFDYRRGCLIGNLGQEMAALPESFRNLLRETFQDWEARIARVLGEAQQAGEVSGQAAPGSMAQFFWIGWEGAVLRAKLEKSSQPLDQFAEGFMALVRSS
ncbi:MULTISPECIES: TetR/AcrR family transcriptional regulator [unclassified Marinobacter]|uniref:acrylate utilization transcriptional regulator AcuR n=1 Tax=unclassified Marinobacter TaxID=83889 RepID=UPI0026E37FB1|nr:MULTISPECIES: TetR/AcrR family transcriptional regulator [unclassified Marinobacter]MDO6441295.1 TetR/AcrR family transcriptional regulator [Marinobacter sp. 2_MG-2023]MDO6822526.1 TetR/AcrR family transcriptional regulator [Marinobacter sp. 1_MG-2023]